MPASDVTIRRATLDDLETLRGLWRESRLPEYDLEKRFTEFQVAVDANGWILAAVGLRFAGPQGQIHSVAVRRRDREEELLEGLWERLLALATQHGALRLWTRDTTPFWGRHGFGTARAEEKKAFPAGFGHVEEPWSTLKLRDEPLKLIAAEEQLEAYLELEKSKTDQAVRRAQFLKVFATVIAVVVFGIAFFALVLVLRRSKGAPKRPKL